MSVVLTGDDIIGIIAVTGMMIVLIIGMIKLL